MNIYNDVVVGYFIAHFTKFSGEILNKFFKP